MPEIRTQKATLAAMREAGLEVVEFRDLARDGDKPWYVTHAPMHIPLKIPCNKTALQNKGQDRHNYMTL